jgi:hypothetical protein
MQTDCIASPDDSSQRPMTPWTLFKKHSSRLLVHRNPSLVDSRIKRHGSFAYWLTFDEINGARKRSASTMSLA